MTIPCLLKLATINQQLNIHTSNCFSRLSRLKLKIKIQKENIYKGVDDEKRVIAW